MLVDPTVPTPAPSTLLIRDRAMVANLESVRMIICSNQVFLLSGGWSGPRCQLTDFATVVIAGWPR
jgi:hypothetical protein